jgi:hypothetical protein
MGDIVTPRSSVSLPEPPCPLLSSSFGASVMSAPASGVSLQRAIEGLSAAAVVTPIPTSLVHFAVSFVVNTKERGRATPPPPNQHTYSLQAGAAAAILWKVEFETS